MAASVGTIVANIYYAQPLLADIARTFELSVTGAGVMAMVMQAGAGVGQLVFVPLGDIRERRRLITLLVTGAAVALALTASARNQAWLMAAALCVGMTASINHVIIPYAAHLAPPAQRGRVVGTVISGLLVGVLVARAFSGWLGGLFGWRAVFWVASALMAMLALLLRTSLPESRPEVKLRWPQLIASVPPLWRGLPVLREAAFTSSVLFCVFSGFWTALVFFVEGPPYYYTSRGAGLFSLIGAAGALCAPWAGRMADRHGGRGSVLASMCTMVLAFVVLGTMGTNLAGLIGGVILLDLAMQVCHVSNQTRIYALVPEARSRLNMTYMTCTFTSGALGSFGSVYWFHRAGWWGVCGFSLAVLAAGTIGWWAIGRRGGSPARTAGATADSSGLDPR
jgi:predicted MFS family arabinose efflux permease